MAFVLRCSPLSRALALLISTWGQLMIRRLYSELTREARNGFYFLHELKIETLIVKWLFIWLKVFLAVFLLGAVCLIFPHDKLFISIEEMMQVTIGIIFLHLNFVLYGFAISTAKIPVVGRISFFVAQLGLVIGFTILSAMFGVTLGLVVPMYVYGQYELLNPTYNLMIFFLNSCGYYLLAQVLERWEMIRSIIGEEFYDENEGKYTAIRIVAGLMLFIIGVFNLYEYLVVQ